MSSTAHTCTDGSIVTDPNSGSPEDLETMQAAVNAFLSAGWDLYNVWQHDGSRQYPSYLPSFDEFLTDFAELMDANPDQPPRWERRP